MRIIAYARVSTQDQCCSRQVEAFKQWEKENNIIIDEIVEEHATGKNFDRIKYQKMKEELQKDDVLIIKELDRLGRSMEKIKDQWNYFMSKGIKIIVLDMPLISSDLKGSKTLDMKFIANLVFEVLCYSAEKEREKLSQRTKEALAVKKANGVKLGRPNTYSEEIINAAMEDFKNGMKLREISLKYNVSIDRVSVWKRERGITLKERKNK